MKGIDLDVVEQALRFAVLGMQQLGEGRVADRAIDKFNVELLKVQALRAGRAAPGAEPQEAIVKGELWPDDPEEQPMRGHFAVKSAKPAPFAEQELDDEGYCESIRRGVAR